MLTQREVAAHANKWGRNVCVCLRVCVCASHLVKEGEHAHVYACVRVCACFFCRALVAVGYMVVALPGVK